MLKIFCVYTGVHYHLNGKDVNGMTQKSCHDSCCFVFRGKILIYPTFTNNPGQMCIEISHLYIT